MPGDSGGIFALAGAWQRAPTRPPPALEGLLRNHLELQFGAQRARALLGAADPERVAAAYDTIPPHAFRPLAGRVPIEAFAYLPALWRLDPLRWRRPAQVASPAAPVRRATPRMSEMAKTSAHAGVQVLRRVAGTGTVRDRAAGYLEALDGRLPVSGRPEAGALIPLLGRFPWFAAAVRPLLADLRLAARLGAPVAPLPPLLILGPPGIGKSAFAIALADALSRSAFLKHMAGVSDAVSIVGSEPTFREADASLPVRAVAATGVADPLVVLDELDKTGTSSFNGNAHASLMPLLEGVTTRRWRDPLLDAEVDASRIGWVATANDIAGVPAPMLSRLRILRPTRPQLEHLPLILDGFRRALADEYGVVLARVPPLPEVALAELARELAETGDLRRLGAAWREALTPPNLRLVSERKGGAG